MRKYKSFACFFSLRTAKKIRWQEENLFRKDPMGMNKSMKTVCMNLNVINFVFYLN